MLLDPSKQIRDCHQHALRCREAAGHAHNAFEENDYLLLEERWLRLAQSYERTQRITRYLYEQEARLGKH
jgi:hypothetical protein